MKKGSYVALFIIVTIVAALLMSSLWQGFGFALTIAIFVFSLICIGTAICGIYVGFAEIKDMNLLNALEFFAIAIVCGFIGIKIMVWLSAALH